MTGRTMRAAARPRYGSPHDVITVRDVTKPNLTEGVFFRGEVQPFRPGRSSPECWNPAGLSRRSNAAIPSTGPPMHLGAAHTRAKIVINGPGEGRQKSVSSVTFGTTAIGIAWRHRTRFIHG
jgi:hypothetical protein